MDRIWLFFDVTRNEGCAPNAPEKSGKYLRLGDIGKED